MLTYAIVTYGCQMNFHDSERIAGTLESLGYKKAAALSKADLIIVNTCCVRESAESKIMGNIGALKKYKDANDGVKIFVCGCMIEQEAVREKLKLRYRFVDGVFSTNAINELPGLIDKIDKDGSRMFELCYEPLQVEEDQRYSRNTYPLAFVNIMYGCDNFCSYCIVPYVRGRERSREPDSVVREIKRLEDEGYKEVTLLGQNVNSYGKGMGVDFPALLRRIDKETNISRIRFMTSHPKDLTGGLINAYADLERLCPHLHLPVQSGSDRILGLMNRGYGREDYMGLVSRLRKARPDIALTTDIIVGFPTETEAEFQDTLKLVREIEFDSAYTFIYSMRSGTAAAALPDMDRDIKSERISRLIKAQDAITLKKNLALVGREHTVLVQGYSARDALGVCGRTPSAKMVNFKADGSFIGEFAKVRITKANKTTFSGELIDG